MNKLFIVTILFLIAANNGIGLGEIDSDKKPKFDTIESYVKEVLTLINYGDRKVLLEITYNDLDYVLDYASRVFKGNIPFGKRSKVVNSALKGLFNKDPRVILICIDMLKEAHPDRLMEPETLKAFREHAGYPLKKYFQDTKQWLKRKFTDYYKYRDLRGRKATKSLIEELIKLNKFVLRDKIIFRFKNLDRGLMKKLNREMFNILADPIDEEKDDDIPFRSVKARKIFRTSDIPLIVKALDYHSNIDVRRKIALFLVKFYNYNAARLNQYYRNEILFGLKRAYDNSIIPRPALVRYR